MKLPDKYKIGRRVPGTGKFEPSFDIRRAEDGSVHISNVKDLSAEDKKTLMAHLSRPQQGMDGGFEDGRHYTYLRKEEPGSAWHFALAMQFLPEPFGVIG